MKVNKLKVIPSLLAGIPQPPAVLYGAGSNINDCLQQPRVAIVGSRKISSYGRAVTYELSSELASRNIVVVSGLAYGVDETALSAAIDAGGITIAVLPSPIEHIVPASNKRLVQRIIESGGLLLSEYAGNSPIYKTNFVERNRLMSGISDAVLVTEAAKKSGSLHTASFALDQGREVLAVPGNITSPVSEGTNNLLKMGAIPVTEYRDVLQVLGIKDAASGKQKLKGDSPEQQALIDLVSAGINSPDEMLAASQLDPSVFNQTLAMLEITGRFKITAGNKWVIP